MVAGEVGVEKSVTELESQLEGEISDGNLLAMLHHNPGVDDSGLKEA